MKRIFILIFIFCSMSYFLFGAEMSSYDKVMKVINDYNKKIENENSIELTCYGLDYAGSDKIYDGKIHLIKLGYSLEKRVRYEEARVLFYQLVDDLLEKLNNAEHLKGCFFNSPITYKDLFFRLSFDYYQKGHLKKGDASRIYVFENEVGCHIIETEDVEELTEKKIMPGLSLLETNFLRDSVIQEDPYTRTIIGGRGPLPQRKTTGDKK